MVSGKNIGRLLLALLVLTMVAVLSGTAAAATGNLDTTAELYGYSAMWIAVVAGAIALVMYLWGKKLGMSVGVRRWGAIILAIVAVVGVMAMAGVSFFGTTSVATTGAVYDVTLVEDLAHMTVDNDDLEVNCQLSFNYTGDGTFLNNTQYCVVNITLDRTDSGTKTDVALCEVSDIGQVADDAEGKTYYLVSKGTNWAVNWTKAQDPDAVTLRTITKRGLSTTLSVEAGGSNWVLVNITWRADAIDALPLYQNAYTYLNVGGHQVTIAAKVITYAGTPPSS